MSPLTRGNCAGSRVPRSAGFVVVVVAMMAVGVVAVPVVASGADAPIGVRTVGALVVVEPAGDEVPVEPFSKYSSA